MRGDAAPVMADAMVRRKTTEREAIRKEEDLLLFSRSYLSDAFPNPERTGCPPDDALRLMAIRPLGRNESVSEHLTCCSPCFNAYMGHLVQEKAKIRRTTLSRRSAAALGIAAILVIVAYVFLAKRRNAPIVAPKRGQKWRTGCEGRISVVKRRHGLARCRYHGANGMKRWMGLGIIADNLINMGRWLVSQPA